MLPLVLMVEWYCVITAGIYYKIMIEGIIRIWKYIRYGIPVVEKKQIFPKISVLSKGELLKGRTALVTGGTSGIGYEIAKEFLKAGCVVVITGRNIKRLENAVSSLKEEIPDCKIFTFQLDNGDVAQISQSISSILGKYSLSQIDILVNNAGINSGPAGCSYEENFDAIIKTNLKGTFFMAKIFAEYLKSNNIEGNILNIASSSSDRPVTDAYTLSKWGIKGLTKGLARVYSSCGIVVNGIAPGPTATPMLKKDDNDNLVHPKVLTGRLAHPVEIANMAVILVSNMSRMVIGDIVYISGGAGNVYNEDVNYNF